MLDAVVAAARFESSVRRARYLRIERGRGRGRRVTGARLAGVRLALATRELRKHRLA
jgi:hypothetical protein